MDRPTPETPAQSDAPLPILLLIRFSGDLTTKADATRRRMTSRLVENLRQSIKAGQRTAKVVRERNRIFVHLSPQAPQDEPGGSDSAQPIARERAGEGPGESDDEIIARLGRVFGVQSVAKTRAVAWTNLDDIVSAGLDFGQEFVQDRSFAVRARRVGDNHSIPVRSGDIERQLGAALLPHARRVNLSNPDVRIFVETEPERVYFFAEKNRGVAGLPLGTEGRAVSLISGGFDSPVASWRLLRRGVAIDYVFCNLGGRVHQLETIEIAKRLADLWQVGTRPRFHAVDFDAVSQEIQAKVKTRYWQVVLKRMMLRAAEAVADRWKATAIVTGDAIGQVSSQTLQNLSVISDGATYPILRPLIGNNKDEIIAESRLIGTHDLSRKVGEYCAIVPSRPSTHAKLRDILYEESQLDPSVLATALETRSSYRLDEVDLEAWSQEDLRAESVASDDFIIDLRPKQDYQTWHYPGALFLDFPEAIKAYGAFDKSKRYVLYCEFGLKSAHLADLMRREGIDARHFSGGLREVRRLADANA